MVNCDLDSADAYYRLQCRLCMAAVDRERRLQEIREIIQEADDRYYDGGNTVLNWKYIFFSIRKASER